MIDGRKRRKGWAVTEGKAGWLGLRAWTFHNLPMPLELCHLSGVNVQGLETAEKTRRGKQSG